MANNTPWNSEEQAMDQFEKMDAAAEEAMEALLEHWDEETVVELGSWIKYYSKDAGYKRLCRALIAFYDERKS